jgi:hypothetical protein
LFGLAAIVLVLLPLLGLVWTGRLRLLTLQVLGVTAAVLVGALGWLAWDDAIIRRPLSVEEISPAFAGAEESYAVLMEYSKGSASAGARTLEKTRLKFNAVGATKDAAKWIEMVEKNRAALESDWETLAPQRHWIDRLNRFNGIGDLTPARLDAKVMAFQVWRSVSQRVCTHATVQMLDGHSDDAVATLVPILTAARKLQPSSRTLVRSMIAVVVERMCVDVAGIILDRGPVSPAARAQLLEALGPENAGPLARHLVLEESAIFAPVLVRMSLGDLQATMTAREKVTAWRGPLNFLSAFLVNPNATMNLYGDEFYALAGLAETRDLKDFDRRHRVFNHDLMYRHGIKNLGGRVMLSIAMPAYKKVLESYWSAADARVSLRQRLSAPA